MSEYIQRVRRGLKGKKHTQQKIKICLRETSARYLFSGMYIKAFWQEYSKGYLFN
jgi:hypothetical protein